MEAYRVEPGTTVNLDKIPPDDTGKFDSKNDGKAKSQARISEFIEKIPSLQERLYAQGTRSVLIILQGMDTSGKDGTIKHVMSGVNPLGCRVAGFKVPSQKELRHDFLWRVHQEAPEKGYIGLFNRSHYEDVLSPRVHGLLSDKAVKQRFDHIIDFERLLLSQNDTTILKFFLHISKDEQQRRLEARIRDPEKRWKFSPNDIVERKLWHKYMKAYEDAISATSTDRAPWYIVPADYKWYRNLVVAETVVDTLESMKLQYPPTPAGIDFDKLKIE